MFTHEEATAFVVSNFRRAADAHDAGRLREIEDGFNELDAKLTRGGGHEWDKLHIALIFWDSWIDSKNHHWRHYKAIRQRDWPKLAREIADHIEAGREIKNLRVLAHFALRPREGTRSFWRRRGTRKALVKRVIVLFVGLLYLVTWVGGWYSHSKNIRSEAERIRQEGIEQRRRIAEYRKKQGLDPQPAEPPWHEDYPDAGVNWCFPILPGILVAGSYCIAAPMAGVGTLEIVFYYGFDSRVLCQWVTCYS